MNSESERYRCLKTDLFRLKKYSLIPLRETDMELIRKWRNEQINVLRQKKLLTKENQENYYKRFIEPLFEQAQPSQILFSYLFGDQAIGYGGLTNIDWVLNQAEVSFLLDSNRIKDEISYREEFSFFLILMKQIAFMELDLNKLLTETYDIRPLHIGILEKNGFMLESRSKKNVLVGGEYVDSLIHSHYNIRAL